jgi:hypothetical protein
MLLLSAIGLAIGLVLAWDALEGMGDYRWIENIKDFGTNLLRVIAVWILDIAILTVRLLIAAKNVIFLAARLSRFFLVWVLAGGPLHQEGRDAARGWFPTITWNAPQPQTFTSEL